MPASDTMDIIPLMEETPTSPVDVVYLDEELDEPDYPLRAPADTGEAPLPPRRLVSLDAYRGFVMLLMVSGGLGFAKIVENHGADPSFGLVDETGARVGGAWFWLWETLAYQFSHAAWVGCSIWDLIQPSFMFIVGVAMPFSYVRRQIKGQGPLRRFAHVLFRAMLLVMLGVFLSSNSSRYTQTNFTFVNVLTQIGLGYVFVYLLLGRRWTVQLLAALGILAGYWAFFLTYTPPAAEQKAVKQYVQDHQRTIPDENHPLHEQYRQHLNADFDRFKEGTWASQWNKHTNAAAAIDRELLNLLPRQEKFVINNGGYQTLNFIPSLATMLFGVMAGQLLMGRRRRKVLWLLGAGAACFLVVMAMDTTIWPKWMQLETGWSLCPTVKRIWTPTWAVFSTGWTLWLLAAFYWIIDVQRLRFWAYPLVVVGMNSIAIYCMAQLLKPWIGRTIQKHWTTLVSGADKYGLPQPNSAEMIFGSQNVYGPLWQSLAVMLVLWLVCWYLYRKKIFFKV